jgi:hypothetical protein
MRRFVHLVANGQMLELAKAMLLFHPWPTPGYYCGEKTHS